MKNCPACNIGYLTQKFDGTLFSVCGWCKTEITNELESQVNKVIKLAENRGVRQENERCVRILRSHPYENSLLVMYADEIERRS